MDINRTFTIKEIKELNSLELKELRNISGIYKIENLNTHKVYIGHASYIGDRWKQHITMLENNEHHSHTMQSAYNLIRKHNRDIKFVFSIVEITLKEKEDLFLREKYWIDNYNSLYDGYNEADIGSCLTKKLIKSKKKKENAKKYYKIFDEIYNSNKIYFGSIFLSKIKQKHYSANTMKRICAFMLWYLNNYGKTNYIGKFGYGFSKELRVMIYNKEQLIDDYTYNGKRVQSYIVAEINKNNKTLIYTSFEQEYDKFKIKES